MGQHADIDHTGLTGVGGMTNPMTTQDDIIIGGASGAPARLAKGSDGQVLTVDPTTHHLVWATPTGGGGGGTQAYLGYTSVGASFQTMNSNTFYCRKITVPTGGGFLQSIDAHIKGLNDGGVSEYRVGLWDDSAGSPTNARIAYGTPQDVHYAGVAARWMSFGASSPFLAAGDYWIGIAAAGSVALAYDTGGSTSDNKTFASGGQWITDASQGGTITGVTNQHSLRANMLYV